MPEIASSRRYINRQYKEEVEEEFSLFYSSYVFVFTCMHFVCSLYASLTAYIFMPSALLLSQTVFLYALYAVNSGVMSSHRAHSRFFDTYNAYRNAIITVHTTFRQHGWSCSEKRMDGTPERSR